MAHQECVLGLLSYVCVAYLPGEGDKQQDRKSISVKIILAKLERNGEIGRIVRWQFEIECHYKSGCSPKLLIPVL